MTTQEIAAALQRVDAVPQHRPAGPRDVRLVVRIAVRGVDARHLRSLVEESYCCSPISSAVRDAVPVELEIEVGGL